MKYYPVNLDIENRDCLVVGGGQVGTRKVATLVDCGARVTLVSPEATLALKALADTGRIAWRQRPYIEKDLDGMFLVIGATSDEPLNRRVHADAQRQNLLCNIADRPEICNFILPAVIRRGDLLIAVSTSGKSPAFAKRLRKSLERQFGTEYETFLQVMGIIRARLLAQAHAPEVHKPLFEQLIDGGLVDLIRMARTAEIDALLARTLGEGFTFADLMAEAGTR
ncbi:MAG: bifunctional precorrin-2 dehydrogenase/sirohydrochlorin ferrochelatase [Desulfobacterales bacterium]|nr:bifunctional precorrin-2 dehydrogenase/sirohydrochlorin ferrochelatase [Desulfobacterales bacterium]